MSWLKCFKFLQLIPVVALSYAAPALAQFEVAPDHFDSNGKNEAKQRPAAKGKASVAQPAVLATAQGATGMKTNKTHATRNTRRHAHAVADSTKPKVNREQASSSVDRSANVRSKSGVASNFAAVAPRQP